jgi:hypothetical protein
MAGLLDWQDDEQRAAQQRALMSYAGDVARQQDRQAVFDALGQTLPAQIVKSLYNAARLPGDVYQGKIDPRSDEAISRSADLAGGVMLGGFPLGAAVGREAAAQGGMALGIVPVQKAAAKKDDEMVRLFHGTTEEGARSINESKSIYGPAYFSPDLTVAKSYSLYNSPEAFVVDVNVPKRLLMIDLDLPGGRLLDVESANLYLDKPSWTIDDYIRNNYSVGVQGGWSW